MNYPYFWLQCVLQCLLLLGAQSDSGPSTRTNTIDENPLIQPQTNPASRDSEECDSLYVKLEQAPNFTLINITTSLNPFLTPYYEITLTCNGSVRVVAKQAVHYPKCRWKLDTTFRISKATMQSIYATAVKERFFDLPTQIEENGSYFYFSKLTISTACKYNSVYDQAHTLERIVDTILSAAGVPAIFGDPLRVPCFYTRRQSELDSLQKFVAEGDSLVQYYLGDIDTRIEDLYNQRRRRLTAVEKDSLLKSERPVHWRY